MSVAMTESSLTSEVKQAVKRELISVVSPVYGCRACLAELTRRIFRVAETMDVDVEVILVNDASPDDAWQTIVDLAASDGRIRGINLLRNFGQHYAISAGLQYATGDWVVVLDCDLQDQPEEIPKLYAKAKEGYLAVFGRRLSRKDSFGKRLTSRFFHFFLTMLSGVNLDHTVANFSIISRDIVTAVREFHDHHRAYALMVYWATDAVAFIEVSHSQRATGKSGYTLGRRLMLASDIIAAVSTRPLIFSAWLGLFMSLLAGAAVVITLFRYLFSGITVPGWTSTIISVWFVGGLLLANMGILGLYLGKVFEQTKNRPPFLVSMTVNMDREVLRAPDPTHPPARIQ